MSTNREYREKMRASGDNTMDEIERDVNRILSDAENVRDILSKSEPENLATSDIEDGISELEEVIEQLKELADKLY